MRVIGIDTHKATLAACAIDDVGQVLGEAAFPNEPAGFEALLTWLRDLGGIERIGLEGSAGFGSAAARFLLAADEAVVEVPPQLSHRERLRTRRAGKSDPGDALAIARVVLREPALPPVRTDDASRDLKLLVEARDDLAAEATRVRNRLHADLVVIAPGYGAVAANLVADTHRRAVGRLLRGMPGVQAELARSRLVRLAVLTRELRALDRRIEGLVDGHPLRVVWGAGPLVTAKLLGETGDVARFRSADAFAMLAGVAPIPASSGQTQRMRLNRGGNRQLNRALHGIALAQVRTYPPAQAFIARKRAEGKSWREALRALKRHLARVVFRLLSAGAISANAGA
ncbi:MAG TPA: IS110 family transposase [Candidatus Limnocylindrales bacterium]|nr:IS110 family transposase [Candidatus Limnocylindrales bacterium]